MNYKTGGISNEFIYCNAGKFEKLAGFDELKEKGIIEDYYLFKWKGAEFTTVENSGDRIAGFTIEANSIDDLKIKHRKAVEKMQVLDDMGNDIMRKDLLENF